MKAAQMFPGDFDGIIAGSLVSTGRVARPAVPRAQALQKEEARITTAARVLHSAVVAACDGLDGVKDGLIENPLACKFDPGVLACKGGEEPACLTQAQVETARLIYSPIVDSKTKRETPVWRGSELGWTDLGWSQSARATGLDHFRYLVFADPQWDIQKFNVATDVARLTEGVSGAIDARDTTQAVLRSWRQADSCPRLERPADHPARQHRVPTALSLRTAAGRRSTRHAGCSWRPAWRTAAAARDRTIRRADGAGAVGGTRQSARHDPGLACEGWESRSDASVVSLSAGGELQGRRKHR